jgi:hypothetical protein
MIKNLPRYERLLEADKAFPDLDPWACAVHLHLRRAEGEILKIAERNLAGPAISPGRFAVLPSALVALFNEINGSTAAISGGFDEHADVLPGSASKP